MSLTTKPKSSRKLADAKPELIRLNGIDWWQDMIFNAARVETVDELPERYRKDVKEALK